MAVVQTDLRQLCLALGSHLLPLARGSGQLAEARTELEQLLDSGKALARFRAFVQAQGGNPRVADDPGAVLPTAPLQEDMEAPNGGYVCAIDALALGEAARDLGAGRQKKGDAIDMAAGLNLRASVGQPIAVGAPWVTLYAKDTAHLDAGRSRLAHALSITASPTNRAPLIYGVVHPDGREERLMTSSAILHDGHLQ